MHLNLDETAGLDDFVIPRYFRDGSGCGIQPIHDCAFLRLRARYQVLPSLCIAEQCSTPRVIQPGPEFTLPR